MIKYFIRQYWRYIAMALAFASITFLSNACEVHAESISDYRMSVDLYYRIGNSGSFSSANPRITSFQTNQQGQTLQLEIYAWLQSDESLEDQTAGTPNVWGRWTICADRDSFTEGYNVANTTNVTFINTSIPCKLANAPNYSNAYITFATFKSTNVQNVTQNNYGPYGKITFDVPANTIASTFLINSSWTILAFEMSMNGFPTYSQDSAVFDKLDTMISAINTLISQSNNSNVVSAINGTTNAINNQTTTITNAQNQTTNAINGVNNSINDSSTDDPTNDLNDMSSNEASNSVISDLLLLPVNMFQKILNSINGTCNTFSLGALFGTNLTLPCINIPDYIGSTLWGAIDVIFCGMFMLSMRKKFVDIFENITSLKDRGNELE